MVPARHGSSPNTAFKVVVLPAPLGPSMATSSPARTSNETSCRAGRSPYATLRPLTCNMVPFPVALPEIGFDNARMPHDLLRPPLGNKLPKAQNGNAGAEAGHRLDDVLDNQNGQAQFPVQGAHRPQHLRRLVRGKAGHDFTQEQQLGTGCQGAQHLQPFALGESQTASQAVSLYREFAQLQELQGLATGLAQRGL